MSVTDGRGSTAERSGDRKPRPFVVLFQTFFEQFFSSVNVLNIWDSAFAKETTC